MTAGDSAVDGDHKAGMFFGGEPSERIGIDAVTFFDAVRNVVADVRGAGDLEAFPEDAGAADAVDVVVAIDHDSTAVANGLHDEAGGGGGAGDLFGVGEGAEFGIEIGDCAHMIINAAIEE